MADEESATEMGRNQVQLADILNTAHSLVSMLNSRLSSSGNVRPVRQGNTSQSPEGPGAQTESPQQTGQVVMIPQRSGFGQSVHQEMARSFPGLFHKEAKGKRRFAPYA
ncbi:hypothetical protein KOW79_013802 [Hemibagrus wyckioides]|uniref:Uncharacterized protein n=1 Tax=Hemibagrus wyckioides TaxID=337641 RepID=A0A9D3NGW7_9TELE|nr:hypothetical protein KOW79_013802 [Hemibagrus wyckioides]